MKPYKGIVQLLLGIFVFLGVMQGQTNSAEEFTVNGLKVVVKHNPANSIVSAQLYLRGGSLNIGEATQGIEPLIFTSALKGTRSFSKEALNGMLDKTGAVISSASTRDYSVVTLRCLVRDLDVVWKAYADVVMNPAFDPSEVEIVRKNQLLGVKQRNDNPDGYLNEIGNELFYKNHPYSMDPGGTETSLPGITIEQMKKHVADNLVTSKLLLVVVGNVSRDDIQKKVTDTFARLPKGSYRPAAPQGVKLTSSNLKVQERQLPTNYIIGLFAVPRMGDPDYYAARVAMSILGNRVFEEVRTKRNLSYAPSAYMENQFVNRGAIYVTAVKPDTTIKVFFAELKRLQNEPVSDRDMRDRIALFLTGYSLSNETNDAQARFLAQPELAGVGWKEGDRFVENIRRVSATDVQDFARKYFRNLQVAVVGNPLLIDEKLFSSM